MEVDAGRVRIDGGGKGGEVGGEDGFMRGRCGDEVDARGVRLSREAGEGCNHQDEVRLHPIPMDEYRVEKEGGPRKFIEDVISPQQEAAVFLCRRDDELEVLRDVFLVGLKNPTAFLRVIAPRG